MAESAEIEFLRQSLVTGGTYTAEQFQALVEAWDGSGTFLKSLVGVGILDTAGANTIAAVIKGYAKIPRSTLLALFGPPPKIEGAGAPPVAAATPGPRAAEASPRADAEMSGLRLGEAGASGVRARADAETSGASAIRARPVDGEASGVRARGGLSEGAGKSGRWVQRPTPSPAGRRPDADAVHAAVSAAIAGRVEPVREDSPTTARAPDPGPPRDLDALAPGDVFAGWTVRARLERSATRGAYLVDGARPGVLRLLAGPGAAARARLLAQARGRLAHPGLAEIVDAGEHAGTPYLVLADVDAIGLDDYLEISGPLGATTVAQIGLDVAQALAAAAELGLGHGDIRPGTVLVHTSDARVKLVGLGPGEPRGDMFGLGATLFRAATGRPPPARSAAVAAMGAQLSDAAPPVHTVVFDFSRAVSRVISRLLKQRPEDRFERWEDVVDALTGAAPGALRTFSEVHVLKSRSGGRA